MAAGLVTMVLLCVVHGVVMRGPTQPVCQVGKPCSAPAVGAVIQFVRGTRVTSVRAGAGGRYSVRLAPGTYAVRVSPTPKIGRGIEPRSVIVPRRADFRADFDIDTGIR
jgi:hypothetical protein